MRYGYCTGFATPRKEGIDEALLADIRQAGYDYVEFPLALLCALGEGDWRALVRQLPQTGLGADCACNMFPPTLRLTGPDAARAPVQAYLGKAFARLAELGTHTLVFGSAGARNLPLGVTPAEGYRQLTALIGQDVVPLLEEYAITLVMEPIGGYEANFIRTLPEGMEVVRRVNHPRVQLLADSVHLLWEKEDPADITRFADFLWHVHVCESGRALPSQGYTPALEAILQAVRDCGYARTMSFEPMPHSRAEMAGALQTLKAFMAAR